MLSTEDSAFFIHVDRKVNTQAFRDVTGDNVFVSKERIPVVWGEFSQVVATKLMLQQALDRPEGYDYFVFFQGSDYPLRSGSYVQEFLDRNRGAEFMNIVKMPAPGYPLSKINQLWYSSDQPVRKFASRALGKFGIGQRNYRRYVPGIEAYAGNACWTLSREACRFLLDFADSHPRIPPVERRGRRGPVAPTPRSLPAATSQGAPTPRPSTAARHAPAVSALPAAGGCWCRSGIPPELPLVQFATPRKSVPNYFPRRHPTISTCPSAENKPFPHLPKPPSDPRRIFPRRY